MQYIHLKFTQIGDTINNYSALDYIKIDIANQIGMDKVSFEKRIAWVNKTKHFDKYIARAGKHAPQYMAAVMAYKDALAGVPTGHMVGLDAVSSGIAIMGICMGCKITCSKTGMIGSRRMDMYSECTKEVNSILGSECGIVRDDVKAGQMTYMYGSKKEPEAIFGESTPELNAFYKAQETVAPGAVWLREELLATWQPFAKYHSWTMPDGFEVNNPVLQKVKSKIEIDELNHAQIQFTYEVNEGTEEGVANVANACHSVDGFLVRELNRRTNYDRNQLIEAREALCTLAPLPRVYTRMERLYRKHTFVSLRGIDQVMGDFKLLSPEYRGELIALIDHVLEYESFEVINIHDEHKCHPNHMNRLRQIYVEIMAELAESTVMDSIIGDIIGDPDYRIKKLSDDLGDEIRRGEYFLS